MASIQSKKTKSGKRTYYVVVSQDGRHKWLRAGGLHAAKAMKREVESMQDSERLERLGFGKRERRIDDFFVEYLEYVKLRGAPATVKRYRAAVNAFIAHLQLYVPQLTHVSAIATEHIEDFMRRRLESVELKVLADGNKPGNHKNKQLPKPQTVNYEVSVLRSAFLWGHNREYLSVVPTRRIKKLRVAEKKQARLLSPEECHRLVEMARKKGKEDIRFVVYADAFEFLLNTGLRSGELCNLTWDDLDLETGMIAIRPKAGWTPKSYAREFFLNKLSLEILSKRERAFDWVFVSHNGKQLSTDDVRKELIRIAHEAAVEGLTRVHDLRHTFNSIMQMNGVDAPTMARILGHQDLKTTMIYTHQSQEHLRKSIEKVGI
jgi:integrase